MSTAVIPNGGRSVVEQLCERFPELHVNDDEKQRELTTRIQQQFVYQWGGRWGGKKRTGVDDSLKSKDSLAFWEGTGACSVWDLFQGNAEATILVQDGQPPNFPDLPTSEATFMPVAGVDWLGVPAPGPGPGPEDEEELDEILDALDRLQETQARDTAAIIARDDLNTERVLQKIDDVKTQMEASLKQVLALYLARNRPDDGSEPIVPPGTEPPSDLQKLVLTWLLQNRPGPTKETL
jgi:hypothetical protein